MQTIYYKDDAVYVLDQNQLPAKVHYEKCLTYQEIAVAIKELKVRGAPLIGVTAAFGMALAIQNFNNEKNLLAFYEEVESVMRSTRPTAVNLFWAIRRMRRVFETHLGLDQVELAKIMLREAQDMYEEDLRINIDMGEYGQTLLGSDSQVMTICNAGALATCGHGTALGVIRAAHARKHIQRVWACETRPVLQGSRLTIWELMEDKIPVTLITDNMAASVLRDKNITAVIAGADRIAANGDTANKIGTYGLAVLARQHGVPFYIAAPLSTIDMSISNGEEIPIEERNQDEVRMVRGTYITVPEVDVFNPAFDVTPHEFIDGIITEKGIIQAPYIKGLKAVFSEGGDV
ncbi:MAG: S-methyl-5-thioribose-1-phosphate isomerase [Bacillota bacterium]|nr:S-methyl-5-thioribose-1-phosphate isomerase [Bacillota bacterium]